MNTTNTAPAPGFDDLPNDPYLLKERILRQNALLGSQVLEIDVLRDENRYLKRKNRALCRVLCPVN
jgi:hypothetical protein